MHGLLTNQQGDATPFYSEPQGAAIYASGGPPAATVRQLERHFGAATANNIYAGNANDPVVRYMADPTTEQLLHFTDADPNRTPTFTVFPKGDYFFTGGAADSPACGAISPTNPPSQACATINSGFAYNHGYYGPEIDITWLGMVGPGVANRGLDGPPATATPDQTRTVADNSTAGTWSDHTDIRPTMLALVGLSDSYTDDGRVLTEDLSTAPGHTGDPNYQPLAICYKQLNSSVGRFGTAALVQPPSQVPEVRWPVLLPLVAGLLGAGALVAGRRRRRMSA